MALLILYNDDINYHMRMLWKECASIDVNRFGMIQKQAFEDLVKTTFSSSPNEDIETIKNLSLERFLKKDSTEFVYSETDENGMPLLVENIINYRANVIMQGLIQNDRNKLEGYLMEYFEEADQGKTGYLTQPQLLEALKKCPKLTLIGSEVAYPLSSSI